MPTKRMKDVTSFRYARFVFSLVRFANHSASGGTSARRWNSIFESSRSSLATTGTFKKSSLVPLKPIEITTPTECDKIGYRTQGKSERGDSRGVPRVLAANAANVPADSIGFILTPHCETKPTWNFPGERDSLRFHSRETAKLRPRAAFNG